MSTPAEYVLFLSRNGVKLWVEEGQLRYRARKGVLGSEELERLRSMRSEIVAELTKATATDAGSSSRAHAANAIEGPVSLQQRWFLKLLERHPNWRATLHYVFHLRGPLDPVELERSFERALRHHVSLRTRIICVCGEWRQQVGPSNGFQLPIVHASGETDAHKQQSALVTIQKLGTQALDPVVDPSIRGVLVRVSAREHFLVVLIHRLAADCLGIGQAFRDLWVLYAGMTQNASLASPEQSTRYLDYALRQRDTDGAWRQKHTAYWNEYLGGAECIRWPAHDCTPPANGNAPVLASLETSFGKELSAKLKELGRQTQTLPALILLSIYVVCVSLWCKQRDLVIPFIIAGRGAAHEDVVGCFSHVVYLRMRLKGNESFADVLKLVSTQFYRAAAFRQDSGRMATERPEFLRGTVFQWLSWHPADIVGFQADDKTGPPGLEVRAARCQSLEELTNVPPDMVDLEISFFDPAGDISALALYRTDRFAEGNLARLMDKLRSVSELAVRDPSTPFCVQDDSSSRAVG